MASDERVIVPAHTPKPLPNHLRSELTSALLSTSAIPVIQSTLQKASQEEGWTPSIRARAKQLISSGQVMNWQEVVEVLVKESIERQDKQPTLPGGIRRVRQDRNSAVELAKTADEAISVKFPAQAITEGKKAIRDALDHVIEVEGAGVIG
ncbi:MAG: hypothetical protein LQ346_004886 [Caloplaca aetnensis]|nr:MAG: hypothetical protein LQ346_004886 [Caloplaca aetnensis]